mgnify:CR=1 FL=1
MCGGGDSAGGGSQNTGYSPNSKGTLSTNFGGNRATNNTDTTGNQNDSFTHAYARGLQKNPLLVGLPGGFALNAINAFNKSTKQSGVPANYDSPLNAGGGSRGGSSRAVAGKVKEKIEVTKPAVVLSEEVKLGEPINPQLSTKAKNNRKSTILTRRRGSSLGSPNIGRTLLGG